MLIRPDWAATLIVANRSQDGSVNALPYLAHLEVDDLALLAHVVLDLKPGLTVLTGETGAGKSLLVDALLAVSGGRTSTSLIRLGSSKARISALVENLNVRLREVLSDVDVQPSSDSLILEREVVQGRSTARLDGRLVPVATLAGVGSTLLAIHGQDDQVRLLDSGMQRALLDRFANNDEVLSHVAACWEVLGSLRRERDTLGGDPRERERRRNLLEHEVAEIEAASITPDEDNVLEERLRVAQSGQALRQKAQAAYHDLLSDGGVHARLGRVLGLLRDVRSVDPALEELAARLDLSSEELQDVAVSLRTYEENLDVDTRTLASLEERQILLHALQRKFGATCTDVLAYAKAASEELASLVQAQTRLLELDTKEEEAKNALEKACATLSLTRTKAAGTLAKAVDAQLAELGLPHARFLVELSATTPTRHGSELVTFVVATNPGEKAGPLGQIASGGEASRIMLAIEVALATQDETPVLIFDEVDAGVGGRLGEILGRKLWQLARHHQVLCVSHLPQLAAYADTHVQVSKHVSSKRTEVSVTPLEESARAREVASMLGAGKSAASLTTAASELLASAVAWKKSAASTGAKLPINTTVKVAVKSSAAKAPLPKVSKRSR